MLTAVYLLLAIIFEALGITSMKLSNGFNQLQPSLLIAVFYLLSFVFLTLTLKRMEVSIAYALWSGIGTLFVAIIGSLYFHEPMTAFKAASLSFIMMGILGLKLS